MRIIIEFVMLAVILFLIVIVVDSTYATTDEPVGGGDRTISQISYFYDKAGDLANGLRGWSTSKDGKHIFSNPSKNIWYGPSDPPDVIWLQIGDHPGEFYYPELEEGLEYDY